MVRNFFALLVLIGLVAAFSPLIMEYEENLKPVGVARHYIDKSPHELGAANIVTSIIVTYRGLDTLGEVTVLFLAATGIMMLLRLKKKKGRKLVHRKASELVGTGAGFLFPLIILLGVYIFVNGHLTPGGGFQGGAVIASGILLLFLADPEKSINKSVLVYIESLSGFFFVLLGLLGIFLAGGFLDSRVLGSGGLGELISAGSIPLIYTLIGLKVGAELSNIIVKFQED